jgi:hypothetical protein
MSTAYPAFPDVYGSDQAKSSSLYETFCIDKFKKYPQKAIQQAKKRNKDCANKILWSGFNSWEYPQTNLFKYKTGGKTLCYTKNQLLLMNQLGIFPEKITKNNYEKVRQTNYSNAPISNTVKQHNCIDYLNIPVDNIHMYVGSRTPITNWESVQPKFSERISSDDIILWYKFEPSWIRDKFNNYIYQLTFKQPFSVPSKILNFNDIASVKLLSNIDSYGDIDLSSNKTLTNQLANWLCAKSDNIPSLQIWKDLSIKLVQPVLAFRGLLFELFTIPDNWKSYQVGQKILISSRNKPMSWSTNFCMSKHFALVDMMGNSSSEAILVGFVLSCVLQPSQIIVDTRLLSVNFLTKIYPNRLQSEIITSPTKENGQLENFECVIEEIVLTDKYFDKTGSNTTRYLPIKSVSKLPIW